MTIAPDASESLRTTVVPLVERAGLFCEDAAVRPRGGRTQVTVVVDLPEDRTGSVDLDTVAALSREISDALDADDAFLGGAAYDLEVGTPGAERTLTAPRHFRRSRGRLLALRTQDGRELTARLLDVSDDDTARVRPQDTPGTKPRTRSRPVADLELPLADIASARVLIEFSPPADLEDLPAGDADDTHPDDQVEG